MRQPILLRRSLPGVDRVKPERNLGAAKPPSAKSETNLRPSSAQVTEPPYADPHVRWCGRGGAARLPPIPISAPKFNRIRTAAGRQTKLVKNAGAVPPSGSPPRCRPRKFRRQAPSPPPALRASSRPQSLQTGLGEQASRSEEHTSELQSRGHLVCRLLLEKKK